MLKQKGFEKLACLWLVGEVVDVGVYGSKAAEGC